MTVAAGPVRAQDVASDDLAACAAIEDAVGRLACFEALVPAKPAPAAEPAPPFAEPVEPAAAAVAPVAAKAGASEDATGVEKSVAGSAADGAEAFGEEHLDRDAEESPVLRATVVDVTRAWDDSLSFHLDNGQVWRQIESRRFPYPKNGEFEVEIARGMMGEYRLRVGGESRMVRIRRVK
jgi:hypothetical protein